MSLITDVEYLIQTLRIEYLRTEDTLAERTIIFTNTDQQVSEYTLSQDCIPERSICYSPTIPNLPTELQQKHIKIQNLKVKIKKNGSKDNLVQPLQKENVESVQPITFIKEEAKATAGNAKSFLSMKLKAASASKNPFQKYAFVSGKSDNSAISLKIYFPQHTNKPLNIVVKRDASVEEVIGYSLFVYYEDNKDVGGELMSFVASWNLRIVEDDGQIDEDFPALERSRKIQKFSFGQFALVFNEEHAKQMLKQANDATKASSHTSNKKEKNDPSSTTISQTAITSKKIAVHLYSTLEVKQTTTVNLPGDMLLSEVLIYCCRKRKIDPNDYTLKMADTKTDVPLDRTLESLSLTEICLLKKDRGPSAGDIFLRPPEELSSSLTDLPTTINLNDEYTSVYKKYLVIRKMPLQLTKQERYLAIDGDYIYIMAVGDRLFDSTKTISFHASAVVSCGVSKKGSCVFRLCVERNSGDVKNYDFEAGSWVEALEICNKISFMSQFNKK